MKFSGKMYLMIILKVTVKQGFTLSLEYTLFEKPEGEGGGLVFKVAMPVLSSNCQL